MADRIAAFFSDLVRAEPKLAGLEYGDVKRLCDDFAESAPMSAREYLESIGGEYGVREHLDKLLERGESCQRGS